MLKKWLFLSLGELLSLPLPAQVTLDGTLGTPLTLPGPDYQIGAELGQQRGNNLFHSFSDFNLAAGESATFSGPASINNIISRVTGGQASHLNGLLRSTIPNADVYLINPAGISFGPQATLDISGSFHASSADVLRFEDGGTFNARQPDQSVLSIAPVAAFGFLTDSPGALTVEGSHLSVPEQQSFSLLGGEITLNQAQLQAPFGRLNLASVASAGEIGLEPTALKLTGSRGNISIRDSQIDLSGEGGGALDLQGGQIVMTASKVDTVTQGSAAGRGVKIQADQLMMEGGYLFSDTEGSGPGGDIEIEAGSVNLAVGAALTANVDGSGDGGKIKIAAQQVTLTTGGMVSVSTFGTGHAGKLTLNAADKLLIVKDSSISALVGSSATGVGGDIQIDAKQVVLDTGGIIANGMFGQGQGGNLNLTAAEILLITGKGNNDRSSAILALVGSSATGDGGEVQIKAKQITVESQGQIVVGTLGTGNAGKLTLNATDKLLITGGSLVSAYSDATGAGGEVQIQAEQVTLADGGSVFVSNLGAGSAGKLTLIATDKLLITGKNGDNNSSITAGVNSDATGAGSEVQIEAKQITVESGGRISADTFGTGNAGKLTLTATDKLLITGDSQVSAQSGGAGNGGDIQIEAKQITVESGGKISASTLGAGNAGKLTLTTTDKLLISNGVISADSMATGAGGEIQIEAKQVTLEARGLISTSTYEEGHAGKITLVATDELLITENSFIGASTVSGSKGNGGEIQVEAKQVILETGGQILVGTHGEGYAGKLTLSVADKLLITEDSFVESSTFGASGAGGDLQIKARQVMLEAGGKISVGTFGTGHAGKLTLIATDKLLITGKESFIIAGVVPGASGAGGDVQIEAKQVTLEAGGKISVGTGGEKPAGKLTLIATDKLLITTGGWVMATVEPGASGVGGDVQIEAKQVTLEAGGEISVGTLGKGHAGKLTLIATDKLLISGDSFIEAGVQPGATGAGGDVQIEAKQVTLEAGGKISVDTFGEGHAGNTLIATDKLLVTGKGSNGTTASLVGASVQPGATGDGGNIKVEAKQVTLAAGGIIFANTFGPGRGGNLNLTTDTLLITQGGAIGAGSSDNGGTAGEIIIKANGNIQLQNQNSRISATTDGAAGGNISITTTGLLQLTDQSKINTSVQANQGNGGNITLQPLFLILDDSKILAQAIEGHGGDINIKTNDIYVFPSAQFPQAANQERLKQAINASSQLGVSGTITINSPDINVGKDLVVFSTSMTDASSKLKQCVAKALSERSHFYIKHLPARRLVIDDLRASRLLLASTASPAAQTTNTPADQSPPPVALLIGCRQEPNQESSTDAVPTQLF